jgi:uncharacterized protein YceK
MKCPKNLAVGIIFGVVIVLSSGCATYRTISAVTQGSPRVYSGTRLDINAISDNRVALMKFDVGPPEHPLLDLPASLALDTVIFPLTSASALYEMLLE